MIMIDVTEWIIDLLLCGIAIVTWGVGVFIIGLLYSIACQWYERRKQRRIK